MKKLVALLLTIIMVLAMTACGGRTEAPTVATPTETQAKATPTEAAETAAPSFELPGDVEYVVPFSAGGGSDLYSRTAANIMSELNLLGKRAVTVTNKPGGGGSVGDAYTVTKKGDGTTITAYVSAQITSPITTGTGITYDQLTPICNLALDEYTIGISASAEYQTMEEFLAYAKAHPGEITVGGSGMGTEDNLCTGLIEMYCDVDLEYIPYDSSGEVMTAVLGGHLNAGIFNPNEAISQYQAGEVLLIGAFGPERISVLPEVPTFTEQGYKDVQFQQFRGVFGPPDMEPAAVDFWVNVYSQVVEHPDWTEGYLAKNGLTANFIYGEAYQSFIDNEAAKYQSVLDSLGLSAK
ncbi:MAG: tripartite tricarboxylate transporter substrate binding protein [Eubacteriales bacterium]|nr:tripartite tricarboxylate transporter substrate binding protein [Eubacteriales bacterium]